VPASSLGMVAPTCFLHTACVCHACCRTPFGQISPVPVHKYEWAFSKTIAKDSVRERSPVHLLRESALGNTASSSSRDCARQFFEGWSPPHASCTLHVFVMLVAGRPLVKFRPSLFISTNGPLAKQVRKTLFENGPPFIY